MTVLTWIQETTMQAYTNQDMLEVYLVYQVRYDLAPFICSLLTVTCSELTSEQIHLACLQHTLHV